MVEEDTIQTEERLIYMGKDTKYNEVDKDHLFNTTLTQDDINELAKHPRIPARPTREEALRARGLLDNDK